jgi:hypothetical protein
MILDHTIGSARAEKRKDAIARRIFRDALTAFLALGMILPSLAALGMESSPRPAAAKPGDMLPLPPIPYLDSIPWMKWNMTAPTLRIDTLMTPNVTLWGVLQDPRDRVPAMPTIS